MGSHVSTFLGFPKQFFSNFPSHALCIFLCHPFKFEFLFPFSKALLAPNVLADRFTLFVIQIPWKKSSGDKKNRYYYEQLVDIKAN